MNSISVEDSVKLMDYLCQRGLNRWIIYSQFDTNTEQMTDQKIKDSIKYIIEDIYTNMTIATKERLEVAFKMNTQEDVISSIQSVAMEHVLEFSIKNNIPIDDDKQAMTNYNIM